METNKTEPSTNCQMTETVVTLHLTAAAFMVPLNLNESRENERVMQNQVSPESGEKFLRKLNDFSELE